MQYHDGLYGALIVRPNPPMVKRWEAMEYDEERIIILSDWFHADGSALSSSALDVPTRVWQLHSPRSVLINGQGRYSCSDAPASNGCISSTPLHVIRVKRGLRYRLRIICAATRVALTFSIQSHMFTVVQSQAENVVPIRDVKTLQLSIGARYDAILHANQTGGNFWIGSEIVGCTGCSDSNGTGNVQPSLGLRGYAILRYEDAPHSEPTAPFSSLDENAQFGASLSQNDDRVLPMTPGSVPEPTVRWLLNSTKISPEVRWRLNGHLFDHPSVPIIFNPYQDFPERSLIWSVQQGDVVDVVWHSHSNMDHPVHLHGHKFWLLGHGHSPYRAALGLSRTPPMRYDTVNLVGGGWVHLRFVAERPGPWMMHCHIDFHTVEAMALVVNVLPTNRADFVVPAAFPVCDSYPAQLAHRVQPSAAPDLESKESVPLPASALGITLLCLFMVLLGGLSGIVLQREILGRQDP